MTRLLPLLLLLGCSPPERCEDYEDSKNIDEIPIHQRFVRVYLKSLRGPEHEVSGKGGLRVLIDGKETTVDGPLRLARYKGGNLVVVGVAGNPVRATVTIIPVAGVFTIDKRSYSGDLFWRHGKLINNVALENYVLGVLRGELPLDKVPVAAAAAQAVAVRSYTLHYVLKHDKQYDLDDTTQYQVYAGLKYAPDDDALREGVNATAGMFLRHDGKPLKAYYHSTCGGHTTDVPTGLNRERVAPMSGVPCDFCRISRYYRWESRLDEPFEIVESGPGKRAKRVRFRGKVMHANEFRLKIGPSRLRSMRILSIHGADVKGAGWGHGVGMCQMGAIGRAAENWSAERIVKYYYPGAELVRAK